MRVERVRTLAGYDDDDDDDGDDDDESDWREAD